MVNFFTCGNAIERGAEDPRQASQVDRLDVASKPRYLPGKFLSKVFIVLIVYVVHQEVFLNLDSL